MVHFWSISYPFTVYFLSEFCLILSILRRFCSKKLIIQILGRLSWLITHEELYEMCGSRPSSSSNETLLLELEASVTNVENGQLVRALASAIIYKTDLRMGFSLPSPAVIHPEMPFRAWVIIASLDLIWPLEKVRSPSKNLSSFLCNGSEHVNQKLFLQFWIFSC